MHRIGILQLTQYLDEAVQGLKAVSPKKYRRRIFLLQCGRQRTKGTARPRTKLKESAVEMIFAQRRLPH